MLSRSRRYLLVILLLVAGVTITWWQQRRAAPEPNADVPSPGSDLVATPSFTYFIDVDGWYRITPYETVVRSPYDFTAENTQAMVEFLPDSVGKWQRAGQDRYIADDPVVVNYLAHPTVAIQRSYQDSAGETIALVLIGNEGDDSFLLFSHTPEICYPSNEWQILENRRESMLIDDQPMYARYLFAEHIQTGDRLAVLYWYLWHNAQRDSQEGVLSMRVNLYLLPGQSEADALASVWDFVRGLFPSTVLWERY